MRQERVLLAAIEAVDLVDEQHGAHAGHEAALCLRNDLANARDAVGHRRELDELALGVARDQACKRGLPRPGRAPKEDRARVAALDGFAERAAAVEQVPLA